MNISRADSIDNTDIISEIETTRKLASIQKIVSISEIPEADKIVKAQVQGWECVIAKKDNFKVGDLVVYFQPDSILPQRPEFEFMRERKFRVRTIRLKKQISSGLIMPLSILPLETEQFCGNMLVTWNNMKGKEAKNAKKIPIEEGLDLTNIIGVIKYDPEGKLEQSLIEKEKRGPFMRFLMGFKFFRYIYLKLNSNIKGNWPVELCGPKTDENRIQTALKVLLDHYNEEWYISEKLDGSSATFFSYYRKVWGRVKKCFGTCSRNIWLKTENNSNYWTISKQFNIKEKLLNNKDLISCQGEIVGEGIQANKYKVKGLDLYIFNVIKNKIRLPLNEAKSFCEENGLKFVPIVFDSFVPIKEIGENKTPMEIVNYMVELSKGKSFLFPRNREGIVVRLYDNPSISFKVISPDFLLEDRD